MNIPKYMPSGQLIIGESNVNSAFTRSCHASNNEIVIYRSDEWFKVFIHETFHQYGLDFSMMNNNMLHSKLSQIYNVDSEINVFEAYCEFWGEFMNVCINSFLMDYDDDDNNNKNNFKEMFEWRVHLLIFYEIKFSVCQQYKILHHMGLQYTDIWNHPKKMMRLYKEKTSVLSYYIIKLVFLQNYHDFVIYCSHQNGSDSIFAFKCDSISQDDLYTFILRYYNHPTMIHNATVARKYLMHHCCSQNEKNALGLTSFLKGLRMSICEFK
jgi:hypothetical protein